MNLHRLSLISIRKDILFFYFPTSGCMWMHAWMRSSSVVKFILIHNINDHEWDLGITKWFKLGRGNIFNLRSHKFTRFSPKLQCYLWCNHQPVLILFCQSWSMTHEFSHLPQLTRHNFAAWIKQLDCKLSDLPCQRFVVEKTIESKYKISKKRN